MEVTDEELVNLCVKGDRIAYEHIVERYNRMVLNFAYRILGSKEDAEDAAQETFLRAYLALPHFRGESKFSTWLYSIIANVCSTHKTRKDKNIELLGIYKSSYNEASRETESKSNIPEETAINNESSERVRKAVASLPPKYSIVITLRYFNEFSYNEIAEILKIPLASVKTRLFRAKEMLKTALDSCKLEV